MTQVYPNLENADMEDMNMKQGVQEPPVLMQPQGYNPNPNPVIIMNTSAPTDNSNKGQQQNITGWTTDILACCDDCGKCMCAFFCPLCYCCTVASKLRESCCVPVCIGTFGILAMRTKIRTMYGISGTICGDYWATCCCTECVLCQMDREMDNRGITRI